jgi:hypothetical protein
MMLRQSGAAHADGSGSDLAPGNLNGLVRLGVRTQRHTTCSASLRHSINIPLERVDIEDQSRCGYRRPRSRDGEPFATALV